MLLTSTCATWRRLSSEGGIAVGEGGTKVLAWSSKLCVGLNPVHVCS